MNKKKEVDNRFNKFGTKSFTAITKINDFIDYLENGKVMGTRCNACDLVFFPPRADCYQCLNSDMEWFEVSGKAKLATYSRLEYAPAGFDADVPYYIALLDYEKFKVFGRITGDTPEDALSVGSLMQIKVTRLPNDQLAYVFEKV